MKSIEELLKIAKKNFPIGSKYPLMYSSGDLHPNKIKATIEPNIIEMNGSPFGIEVGVGYVYLFKEDKWCKSIKDLEVFYEIY